jgi:hypothetical protein
MNIKKKSIILTFLAIQLLSGILLFTNPLSANAQLDFLNLGEQVSPNDNQTSFSSLFSTPENTGSQNTSSNQDDILIPSMSFHDGQDGQDGLSGQDGQDGLSGQDGQDGLSGPERTVIP